MKKKLLLAVSVLLLTSTFAPALYAQPVIVSPRSGPPVARHERIPSRRANQRGMVWQSGFYRWQGGRYVWIPGAYVMPPRPGMVWVPGRWRSTRQGWVWTDGRWR